MSKWVRSKYNEHAERREVSDSLHGLQAWVVNIKNSTGRLYLPWSEYVECPPPEEWIDVSEDCQVGHAVIFKPGESDERLSILHKVDAMRSIDIFHPGNKDNYRIRKVGVEWFSGVHLADAKRGVAFIVERRKA